eukprot:1550310-Prymnesium_polylepis.1
MNTTTHEHASAAVCVRARPRHTSMRALALPQLLPRPLPSLPPPLLPLPPLPLTRRSRTTTTMTTTTTTRCPPTPTT